MSDHTYSNITSKVNGDTYASAVTGLDLMLAQNAIDSKNFKISSFPIYKTDESFSDLAYYAHLIGGDKKALYLPSADTHALAATDNEIWMSNLAKIKNSISLTDSKGKDISFTVFPYDIKSSPYKPVLNTDLSNNGFGQDDIDTSTSLADNSFSIILLATRKTIGETIFINYPSIDYLNSSINVNDSEVYNPIPLMRQQLSPGATAGDTRSGYYSVDYGETESIYDVRIWHANLGDLTGDNTASL